MCDKPVDDFLPTLNVPNWFVRNKMIKKLYNTIFADNNILLFEESFDNFTFSSGETGILSVDLNNTNLDDANFFEDDTETVIYVRFLAWHNRINQRKAFKKK